MLRVWSITTRTAGRFPRTVVVYNRPKADAQEGLLIAWSEGEAEPGKDRLFTVLVDATITQLVDPAKLR